MTPDETMQRVDILLSHVWMVRTFLKHCEEAEEDDELRDIQRSLYDYMLALGGPLSANDATAYLKQAKKKLAKLRRTAELFLEIQPGLSSHTNFQMAARSLQAAVAEVGRILEQPTD
ncbi:MAG TPA: amidohydrolase [Pirellulaceae bacterium]|jgi:cob(I)alamin adenosyltransferase|nr:amidohydrolase [Pirellulaceae bacterium]